MTPRTLIFFAFLGIFCTCGPAELERPDPGSEYVLAHSDDEQIGRELEGFRLTAAVDSLLLRNDFFVSEQQWRAYPGDTSLQMPDSLYLNYTVQTDGGLAVGWHYRDLPVREARFVPSDPLRYPDPAEVAGRTFAWTVDGVNHLFHFAGHEVGVFDNVAGFDVYQLIAEDDAQGRHGKSMGSLRMRTDGNPSFQYYYRLFDGNAKAMRGGFRLTMAQNGELQIENLVQGKGISGPFPLPEYPSLVPAAVTNDQLLQRLNLGRVELGEPGVEPTDTNRIDFAYPEDLSKRGGITRSELTKVDFEFREDGYFAMFTGERKLREGKWKFSEDRNFIMIGAQDQGYSARPISVYNDRYLSFDVPVNLITRKPMGTALSSYYETTVPVRFYAPEVK